MTTTSPDHDQSTESSSKGISQPQRKVDHSKDQLAVLEEIPSDKEPDGRIYWVLVSIPVLFFLIGLFFLCWNQCGLLKPYCSSCCALCTALCTKVGKEDLNPNYGTDLDEVTSVVEVACVIVFIRPFLCSVNMIRHVTIIDNRWGTQILSMRELMQAREQEQVTTTHPTLRSQPFLNN